MVDELKGGGAMNAGGRDLVVVAGGNCSPDDCRWAWPTPMLTE